MQQQVTRHNHYVPMWYQRGFLAKGQHKLHVLNLHPTAKLLPNGETLVEQEVEELGPKLAFKEFDLYTTRLGQTTSVVQTRSAHGSQATSCRFTVDSTISSNT